MTLINGGETGRRPAGEGTHLRSPYQDVLDTLDRGFCIVEVLFDDVDRPVDYRFLEVNAAFEAQSGMSDVVGRTARSLAPELESIWFHLYGHVALTGESLRFERPVESSGRWYDVYAFSVGLPEMRLVGVFFEDITARKREQEHDRLRIREMGHRANNLLGVISAIVQLTSAETITEYRQKLLGRIRAMHASQQLLAQSDGQRLFLERLVQREMESYQETDNERISWKGPSALLAFHEAQTLGLALHELATNALKYGALSVPEGTVSIEWKLRQCGSLNLLWLESGGPMIDPPEDEGFGTNAIKGGIESELNGAVRFDWRPGGLVCHITVPLDGGSPTD